MGASRELVTAVEDAAARQLEELGFNRKPHAYTVEVEQGVLGWVGLNRAVRRGDDQLLVNPVIGVRHQALERQVALLVNEPFHPYLPPSVSAPLSQLGSRGDHLFREASVRKLDRQVKRMVDALASRASEFFERHASLEGLIGALRSGQFGVPDEVAYRLPVALAMWDRRQEAGEQVRASLESLGQRDDAAARRFRAFAAAFLSAPPAGSEPAIR